ncbi:MAG: hypothetical protein QMD94_02380 [Candidatus Omnitrophota bacterium]|nr:hypothetical protein [Candidatus Omnitrophota bacterium]
MKKKILLMFLYFCVFALFGCATTSSKDTSKQSALLEPQSILKFSDIPIPAGFKPLNEKSYSFETSGVRVGVLKYQGKANPDQVVNFYKEQMPIYNWILLNIIEYGNRLLNFDRENETCIIDLATKGNNITLTISLGPKPLSLKKTSKPLK